MALAHNVAWFYYGRGCGTDKGGSLLKAGPLELQLLAICIVTMSK